MMTRRQLMITLPGLSAISTLPSCKAAADTSSTLTIEAGPSRMVCPKKWSEGMRIAKVAATPPFNQVIKLDDPGGPLFPENRPEHWAIYLPKLAPLADLPQIAIHRAA